MGRLTRRRRVSFLDGELVATCQARDAAEEKFPDLVEKVAASNRRWVAVEEQCKRLVSEVTLLYLRGSELCTIMTGAQP
jgi:hypothetical protein